MFTLNKEELSEDIRDKLFILIFLLFLLGSCATPTIEPVVDLTPTSIENEVVSKSTLTPQQPAPTTKGGTQIPTPTPEIENIGIPLEQDQLLPEIPPHEVNVFLESEGVKVSWHGTGSDIVIHYNIYRRTIPSENWEFIASIPVDGDNLGEYVFIDSPVEDPLNVEYSVSAVNLYDKESDYSEPAAVDPNP